ncbi:periplasmic heavy metal sensor [Roseococcus sp. SDR]|uniref:Spy/CpxP family protein refolding chaperone n=1 Tax=Roseococcus sp. SDR TaxID=2835532 RepID=UPI001BCC74C6|nr:periplasmic heavy metal sensor [Roseococcus sp. SDR]MBS7793030.1 periplasmic heavy metal sensor [Roseococcus sp. SDR]MBV1848344.1 periplasmic heavy metal sensor [Roseococcus sp. SDR]
MIRRVALVTLLLATPALAQHNHYAGMQQREIRALSPQQVEDLLAGRGMMLALAAELNGWPGPMHVLELAEPLRLTPEQRRETEALMAAHRAEARRIGAEIVGAERGLDAAFRERRISPEEITAETNRIGALQAALRAEHLRTHLAQTALLTPAQVTRYGELRGYAGGPPAAPGHRHRH